MIVTINLYYVYLGEILSHYWEFGYENAILYTGQYMLTKNKVDSLYFIWLLTLILSLLHISDLEFNLSKTSLMGTLGIACLFTIFPKFILYFCAGPTIIINRVLSWVGLPIINRVFIIIFIIIQAGLMPLILEKIFNIKLSEKCINAC